MNLWQTYPPTYRQAEIERLVWAARAGECAALVGLSGAGKSNLLRCLVERALPVDLPEFALVDCNRLPAATAERLLVLLAESLGGAPGAPASLPSLEKLVAGRLAAHPAGLCLVLDRFDALPPAEIPALAGNLRALRDAFKYRLTFIIAARRALAPESELAELFFANTLWLGALSAADARWSSGNYAARQGLVWDEATHASLYEISRGYPALLRAVCEAFAAGCPLEVEALRQHPAVRRRVDEFWRDQPDAQDIANSGLTGHPLLSGGAAAPKPAPDLASLTAAEHRLWEYLQAHPGTVCSKDDLIRAVWSEEKYIDGLRDDSLAQLVRRLRLKVEADPANPQLIQTVPGRGLLFKGR